MAVCNCEPGICYCVPPEHFITRKDDLFGWSDPESDPINDITVFAREVEKKFTKLGDALKETGQGMVKVLQEHMKAPPPRYTIPSTSLHTATPRERAIIAQAFPGSLMSRGEDRSQSTLIPLPTPTLTPAPSWLTHQYNGSQAYTYVIDNEGTIYERF